MKTNLKNLNKIPKKSHKDIMTFVKMCKKIVGANLRSIILFGSVAKGSASKNSDYDFLIVVKKYPQNDAKIGGKLMSLGSAKMSMPVEPVFIEKSGLDDITSAFSLEVQACGLTVYGEECLNKKIFDECDIKPLIFEGKKIGWQLPA